MTKALSPQQVAQFHEQGFVSPVPVLSAAEAEALRQRLEAFERAFPDDTAKLKTKSHLLCPWVEELTRDPRILDVYEDLIGQDILCYTMAFRVKEPDGKTFAGWHQDGANNPIKPILVIGALAVSECTVANGCLRVISGTHASGILPHRDTGDPDSILSRGQFIDADLDADKAVDLVLKPGEMGLFNSAIVHGSQINRSAERRIVILVEMMPTCAEVRAHRDTANLVRGVDRYGNHDRDPIPTVEFGPAEQAAWQRTTKTRAKNVYANSAVPYGEAYGGRRRSM